MVFHILYGFLSLYLDERNVLYIFFHHFLIDENTIVSGSSDNSIKIWDVESGEVIKTLVGHSKLVSCIAIMNKDTIVSGSFDYTIKIWDVNMASAPLRTIKVHEQLRSKLCELYESDCIFDKFEVSRRRPAAPSAACSSTAGTRPGCARAACSCARAPSTWTPST